jgi:hypothetical protein
MGGFCRAIMHDKQVEISADEKLRRLEENHEKYLRDERDMIRSAKLKGEKKGIKEGIKEGIKRERKESQARAEQKWIAIARQLLHDGHSIDYIEKLLKLNRSKFV